MPSFSDWLEALDKHFMKAFGMPHSCFEDYDWYSEWSSEIMPLEAFDEWRYLAGDKQ